MVKILLTLLLSIVCGVLYRMGGSGNYPRQVRLFGCPLLSLITIWVIHGFHLGVWWAYLTIFGLSVASLSTYWDFLFKGEYDCFILHGLVLGLSMFPLIWDGVGFDFIFIRAVILAVFFEFWNAYHPKKKGDIIEEFGRGVVYILTIPLL